MLLVWHMVHLEIRLGLGFFWNLFVFSQLLSAFGSNFNFSGSSRLEEPDEYGVNLKNVHKRQKKGQKARNFGLWFLCLLDLFFSKIGLYFSLFLFLTGMNQESNVFVQKAEKCRKMEKDFQWKARLFRHFQHSQTGKKIFPESGVKRISRECCYLVGWEKLFSSSTSCWVVFLLLSHWCALLISVLTDCFFHCGQWNT